MAQIVAGSLEMALAPTSMEARVITVAKPPYQIVNVNEVWTQMTGTYSFGVFVRISHICMLMIPFFAE
jgi:hypothetical protein